MLSKLRINNHSADYFRVQVLSPQNSVCMENRVSDVLHISFRSHSNEIHALYNASHV